MKEIIITVVSLLLGGGGFGLLQLLLDNMRSKRDADKKETDDRIEAWQRIAEKNELQIEAHERKIAALEQKVESYNRDFLSIQRYVLALESAMLRAVPPLELPEQPKLEHNQGKK